MAHLLLRRRLHRHRYQQARENRGLLSLLLYRRHHLLLRLQQQQYQQPNEKLAQDVLPTEAHMIRGRACHHHHRRQRSTQWQMVVLVMEGLAASSPLRRC